MRAFYSTSLTRDSLLLTAYYGLYVPALMWRQMQNFSTNALALVLSSTAYSEVDYIRDYEEFLAINNNE